MAEAIEPLCRHSAALVTRTSHGSDFRKFDRQSRALKDCHTTDGVRILDFGFTTATFEVYRVAPAERNLDDRKPDLASIPSGFVRSGSP